MDTPKIFGYVIHTEEEDKAIVAHYGFVAARSFAEATKFLTETLWENVTSVRVYANENGELGYLTLDNVDELLKLEESAIYN